MECVGRDSSGADLMRGSAVTMLSKWPSDMDISSVTILTSFLGYVSTFMSVLTSISHSCAILLQSLYFMFVWQLISVGRASFFHIVHHLSPLLVLIGLYVQVPHFIPVDLVLWQCICVLGVRLVPLRHLSPRYELDANADVMYSPYKECLLRQFGGQYLFNWQTIIHKTYDEDRIFGFSRNKYYVCSWNVWMSVLFIYRRFLTKYRFSFVLSIFYYYQWSGRHRYYLLFHSEYSFNVFFVVVFSIMA